MPSRSYEVFLSYNGDDHDAVEKIAVHLDDVAKLRPWFDKWSLVPGEPWVRNLENGLSASSSCAVFVGNSGEGPWQKPEVEAALRQQVKDQTFRVIPVLLPGSPATPELPTFLSGNTWVDFQRGLDDDNALWRLECGIRGTPPGRGRTKQAKENNDVPTTMTEISSPTPNSPIVPAVRRVSVFISYHHNDGDMVLAHDFSNALSRFGHEVFIDTGIRWGADWVRAINEALGKTDYMVLLLSKDSISSEMVVEEVAIARELARTRKTGPIILPVRLNLPFNDPLPYQLSIYLRNIQQEYWASPSDTTRLIGEFSKVVESGTKWAIDSPIANSLEGLPPNPLRPYFDPRNLTVPGGALETNSRFYILRQADEDVFEQVTRVRGIATVRGPRQTGKTSLIMGTYAALRAMDKKIRVAFIDFQSLSRKSFQSLSAIWKTVADHVAAQLELGQWNSSSWKEDGDHDYFLSMFLNQYVFKDEKTPLLICIDEIDRVFSSPIKDEFFSTLRSFYNWSAYDPSWKQVRWLLGTSSEPSFFIEDLSQSPFNIGLRVELDSFTRQEVEILSRRHGLELKDDVLNKIIEYVGGRPYLVHLILYSLAREPESQDRIFNPSDAGGGLFRDHLHRYLIKFQSDEILAKAMLQVVKGNGCENATIADRLEAGGLVRRDKKQKVVPQCGLYAKFFEEELKK